MRRFPEGSGPKTAPEGSQSSCVQIFHRLTGCDLGLPTRNRGQGRPATGEQVASGGQRGECQESDSEAANTRLLDGCSMPSNADRIYQRVQGPPGPDFALAALYRQRKNDSVTRVVTAS